MRIRKLRSYRNDSRASVVQSDVDGEFLWFSSVDTHPTACPVTFANAVFIPAGRDIDSYRVPSEARRP